LKEYSYLGTIPTNENELKPETEKRITNANTESYALLAEYWMLNNDIAKMAGYVLKKNFKKNVWGNTYIHTHTHTYRASKI
jgi:hypothetical protein